jgi:hypothetical protein
MNVTTNYFLYKWKFIQILTLIINKTFISALAMQCYLNIAEKPSVAKTITYILSL